jgi:hypothetical protein
MSAFGTTRRLAALHQSSRYWSKADIGQSRFLLWLDANDAVDGAHSAASKCHRVVASKRIRTIPLADMSLVEIPQCGGVRRLTGGRPTP